MTWVDVHMFTRAVEGSPDDFVRFWVCNQDIVREESIWDPDASYHLAFPFPPSRLQEDVNALMAVGFEPQGVTELQVRFFPLSRPEGHFYQSIWDDRRFYVRRNPAEIHQELREIEEHLR